MAMLKRKQYRSKTYLAYVRTHDCCSCSATGPSEAHHFMRGSGGLGMKVDDTYTVPLCRRCHACWHTEGVLPGFRNYDHALRLSEQHMYQTEAKLLSEWIRSMEAGAVTKTPGGVF